MCDEIASENQIEGGPAATAAEAARDIQPDVRVKQEAAQTAEPAASPMKDKEEIETAAPADASSVLPSEAPTESAPAVEGSSDPLSVEQAPEAETEKPALVAPETAQETPRPEAGIKEKVVERVVEKPREFTRAEKEEVIHERLKELSPQGVQKRRSKRQSHYEKILAHLKQSGYITNNEAEEICSVSDATATRYMRELTKQDLVVKIGRGRGSKYRLKAAI